MTNNNINAGDAQIDNIVNNIILKLIERKITMHHSVEEWEKVLNGNADNKSRIIQNISIGCKGKS